MKKKLVIGLVVFVLLAGATITGLFFYFIRGMNLPTGSMANTIIPGEKLFTIRLVGTPKRGDLYIFKLPSNPNIYYLKRVIGLPGEKIQILGRRVLINGVEIPERRVKVQTPENEVKSKLQEMSAEGEGNYSVYYFSDSWDKVTPEHGMKYGVAEPYTIPPNSYFVMGDTRDNSLDSRYWGVVPSENLIGKPLMIYDSPYAERLFQKIQ